MKTTLALLAASALTVFTASHALADGNASTFSIKQLGNDNAVFLDQSQSWDGHASVDTQGNNVVATIKDKGRFNKQTYNVTESEGARANILTDGENNEVSVTQRGIQAQGAPSDELYHAVGNSNKLTVDQTNNGKLGGYIRGDNNTLVMTQKNTSPDGNLMRVGVLGNGNTATMVQEGERNIIGTEFPSEINALTIEGNNTITSFSQFGQSNGIVMASAGAPRAWQGGERTITQIGNRNFVRVTK